MRLWPCSWSRRDPPRPRVRRSGHEHSNQAHSTARHRRRLRGHDLGRAAVRRDRLGRVAPPRTLPAVSDRGLEEATEKMRADGAPQVAIDTFAHYYERLAAGEQGTLAEDEIEPVDEVPDADELPEPGDEAGDLLDRTVAIRLNGGLGTSMGMTKA